MKGRLSGITILLCWLCLTVHGQAYFLARNGTIDFVSDAPLELIRANSGQLQGVFEATRGEFAFTVPIRSFKGFNSPLQREHFNENYLESRRFPDATFSGRIIESIDFSVPGHHEVRAKGQLEIHGVRQERIIKGTLDIAPDQIRITTVFSVLLEDHQISVPQIVYQKIAEEIQVKMSITLFPEASK